MLVCQNCQSSIVQGARFCPQCGNKILEETATPVSDGWLEYYSRYSSLPQKVRERMYESFTDEQKFALHAAAASAKLNANQAQTGNMRLRRISLLLLFFGIALGIYFFAAFDTTVVVPEREILGQTIGGHRVHNIGLLQDRQNGIMVGFGLAVIAVVLFVFSHFRQSHSPSPKG